jgi:uncharacterized protein YbjT (DUF2867 family)
MIVKNKVTGQVGRVFVRSLWMRTYTVIIIVDGRETYHVWDMRDCEVVE